MAETYLLEIRGEAGGRWKLSGIRHKGILATVDREFAEWIKKTIEDLNHGYSVHINTVRTVDEA